MKKTNKPSGHSLPVIGTIETNAAGLDVGARQVYVAVPQDRDPQPVRSFETFTEDLQRLGDWLLACGITSVAMESTGVYWIPVFDILEAKGLRVCLVNAHHVKHVPGRKSEPNRHRPRKNELRFQMRTELYRLFGVDLTAVPGISTLTSFTLPTELGTEVCKFPSAPAFAAWLALCPNNCKSGDRLLSTRTRKTRNRINHALRVAAQTLHHSHSYLGAFYRRIRARLGAPKAITATAHKLARILFHLISTRQPYDESVFAGAEQQQQRRRQQQLHKQAKALGFTLVPLEAQPV